MGVARCLWTLDVAPGRNDEACRGEQEGPDGGLVSQLTELGYGDWFTGVLAQPLKHTAAVDWERQFRGSLRLPSVLGHCAHVGLSSYGA